MKPYHDQTELEKTFRSFESIMFDEKDKEEVYASLINNMDQGEVKNKWLKWSNSILTAVVAMIFFIAGGYVVIDQFILDQAHPTQHDQHLQTIELYLENEFTGPNDELSSIFDKGLHPLELDEYLDQNYGDIAVDLEKMIKGNGVLSFLRSAHLNDYQLKPNKIDIQKIEGTQNHVYKYEVEVEYSKYGQTNTATVTGVINLDENGKILLIRNMDDGGLYEKLNQ